ncbi:MAG TPA: site-specific integrase, partial [Candidatus Deferrimicrobium sp.]
PVGDRRRKRGIPLFAEWMEEYLKRVAHERKHPRLLAQDRFYLGLAAGLWKSRQLDTIGTEDVEEARQKIAADRHPGMANKFSSYVSACLGAAFRAGKIPGNPAARLDPRKLNDYPARDRVLSDAEMTRLVEALDAEDEITRTAFQLLITTGARLSEVLWAKWEDVNWKDGTIKLDSPKAGKRQFLSVPKRLVTRLQRMHSTSASPFIVPARTDNTKARADLKPEWEGLKVRAKLEGIRLHDLRRTLSDDTTRRYSLHLASKVLRNTEKVAEKNYQGPINFAEVRKVIEAGSKRLLKGRS